MSNELDRPPAGTACVSCDAIGHFCQATTWSSEELGGLEVCADCARDVWCERTRAIERGELDLLKRFDQPCSPVRTVTPVERERLVVVPDRKAGSLLPYALESVPNAGMGFIARPRAERYQLPVPVKTGQWPDDEAVEPDVQVDVDVEAEVVAVKEEEPMKKGQRISDKVIAAIQASDPAESLKSVATRLGVSDFTVHRYRKLAAETASRQATGETRLTTETASRRATLLASSPVSSPVLIDLPDVAQREHAMAPRLEQPVGPVIEMSIPEASIDRWWGTLAPERKAAILAEHLGL